MSVSPMIYPAVPGWSAPPVPSGVQDALHPAEPAASAKTPPPTAPNIAPATRVFLEEDVREAERLGRQAGFEEGFAQARLAAETALAKNRDAIAQSLREFSRDRDLYFHNVEGEVVSLSLAIVRKILKREAQVDPMLLAGLVRVALERIGVTQYIRMRVHPSQIPAWRAYFDAQHDLALKPELSGDPSLDPNACHLETEMGTTELNLETQLKEIEVGLFDLLAQRPTPK